MAVPNTLNFGLKQWDNSDKPSMEDFNGLNVELDKSLTSLRDGKADKAYANSAMPGITTLSGAVDSLNKD